MVDADIRPRPARRTQSGESRTKTTTDAVGNVLGLQGAMRIGTVRRPEGGEMLRIRRATDVMSRFRRTAVEKLRPWIDRRWTTLRRHRNKSKRQRTRGQDAQHASPKGQMNELSMASRDRTQRHRGSALLARSKGSRRRPPEKQALKTIQTPTSPAIPAQNPRQGMQRLAARRSNRSRQLKRQAPRLAQHLGSHPRPTAKVRFQLRPQSERQ